VETIAITHSGSSGRPRFSCALLGHRAAAERSCECLKEQLLEARGYTHVRHILSCFLFSHTFVRLVDRHDHHEYVCKDCGHQLLLSAKNDPFISRPSFLKRPRYWCSVFGHRVSSIAEREGFVEYACSCGHSFLKERKGLTRIKHPVTCTLAGHFVRFVCRRNGFSEYVCRICGHTFCYLGAGA
jgi:hypothetical protein